MKFAVIAISMVVLAGTFHVMFIMFDYAYYNPSTGVFPKLQSVMDETMNTEFRNRAQNQSQMFREGFGIGRFIYIALCIVFSGIEALTRRRVTTG